LSFCYTFCARFFSFSATATTEIYTLSLHDALPICLAEAALGFAAVLGAAGLASAAGVLAMAALAGALAAGFASGLAGALAAGFGDRKSTRLNSSHVEISYAVFCLKKKKKKRQ